jgi:replicative DNA helicase
MTHERQQIPPVGPCPGVAELLAGSLLYSSAAEAEAVLALVRDDDITDEPLRIIVSSVRALVSRGAPTGPQLVLDELKRTGRLTRQVATVLAAITTTGACPNAAQSYAAATVAESLRRKVESAGHALTDAAFAAAEADLAPLAEKAAKSALDCAERLALLRGDR